jgi:hypothetical protein
VGEVVCDEDDSIGQLRESGQWGLELEQRLRCDGLVHQERDLYPLHVDHVIAYGLQALICRATIDDISPRL